MNDDDTEDGALPSQSQESSKQIGIFGSTGIQLSDAELYSPITVKFLREKINNNENEIRRLVAFESQFYNKREECEVLKGKNSNLENQISSKKEMENIQKAMITMGGLILGALKMFDQAPWFAALLLGLTGGSLIICGIFPVFQFGSKA
jgi:hypothetical protein